MTEKEFIKFCIENAVIFIIMYTFFVILLVAWLVNRINKIKDMFTNMTIDIQNAYRTYNMDLEDRDKVSYQLSKNTKKVVNDISYISKILDQYKGQMFDTKLNNQISSQILQEINSDSINTNTSCKDTTRLKINPDKKNDALNNYKKSNLINLSEFADDSYNDEYSIEKIGKSNDNRYCISDLYNTIKKKNKKEPNNNNNNNNNNNIYNMDKQFNPYW